MTHKQKMATRDFTSDVEMYREANGLSSEVPFDELFHMMIRDEWTILHCAASKGDEGMVSQILIVAPDLINRITSRYSKTALHLAAEGGHDRVARLLLAANPESINHSATAFLTAVNNGHLAVAKLFLAIKPELIYMKTATKSMHCKSQPLMVMWRLWRIF